MSDRSIKITVMTQEGSNQFVYELLRDVEDLDFLEYQTMLTTIEGNIQEALEAVGCDAPNPD